MISSDSFPSLMAARFAALTQSEPIKRAGSIIIPKNSQYYTQEKPIF